MEKTALVAVVEKNALVAVAEKNALVAVVVALFSNSAIFKQSAHRWRVSKILLKKLI